jgi:sugar phosphate isomerase/epimerase
MNRRTFVKSAAAATAALHIPFAGHSHTMARTKTFKLSLSPGNLGVSLDQQGTLDAAIQYSYEAIIAMPGVLQQWSETTMATFLKKMSDHHISWGSAGLPVQFRQDEARFKADLAQLADAAKTLQRVGATRMNTWIMPTQPTLPYAANMQEHASRLGECAKVLADYGVQLGLEYVGPKTLMARDRYPFIHTLGECLNLIDATGQENVGIQLDAFHWYCGEDTVEDLRQLDPNRIVTVDLNDARSDLSRDQQIDGTRELVGTTGVVDISTFLNALVDINYTGPVRSEPFNQPLRDMDDDQALQLDMQCLQNALSKSGLQ